MVIFGAALYCFDVFLAGAFAPQATFEELELEELPLLFVTWRITKMITNGIRSSPKFRMLRFRLCFFSASNSATRRASRFWRWRSRFSELGTAGESTDGISGGRIAGALR